jgi:hypothetical protein
MSCRTCPKPSGLTSEKVFVSFKKEPLLSPPHRSPLDVTRRARQKFSWQIFWGFVLQNEKHLGGWRTLVIGAESTF